MIASQHSGQLLQRPWRSQRLHHLLMICALIILFAASGIGAAWFWERSHADAHVLLFVIPEGSARRQAVGQASVMLPQTITFTVGRHDTLVIQNQDRFPATIGPFRIGPGQHYIQRFRRADSFELLCTTLYHKERVRVVVQEPAGVDVWLWLRNLLRDLG